MSILSFSTVKKSTATLDNILSFSVLPGLARLAINQNLFETENWNKKLDWEIKINLSMKKAWKHSSDQINRTRDLFMKLEDKKALIKSIKLNFFESLELWCFFSSLHTPDWGLDSRLLSKLFSRHKLKVEANITNLYSTEDYINEADNKESLNLRETLTWNNKFVFLSI